jgi:NAD(P)-dependent dehydrogenase (short-subunit alcohol dehydrogenase family)
MNSTTHSHITTPFGVESTAAEVTDGIDLIGKRIIVTGGASGIGVETARALTAIGADVTLAVRDTQSGARVAADIAASTGWPAPRVEPLELTDRASIARFVDAWKGPLHVLINNAGVMALPDRQLTADGWEMQFATNHLGHLALTLGLYEALAAAGEARVVSVSSAAHLLSPVVFNDIHFSHRPYDRLLAYGQSKTANVLFAVELTRRWSRDGITANALMPGAIMTNLQRHVDAETLAGWRGGSYRFKTPEQGAATSVLLATSPGVAGVGGRYFEDCNEAEVVAGTASMMPGVGSVRRGVADYALDPVSALRLWEMSVQMLGL